MQDNIILSGNILVILRFMVNEFRTTHGPYIPINISPTIYVHVRHFHGLSVHLKSNAYYLSFHYANITIAPVHCQSKWPTDKKTWID